MYNPKNIAFFIFSDNVSYDKYAKTITINTKRAISKSLFNVEISITMDATLTYNGIVNKKRVDVNYLTIYISDFATKEIIFSEHINKRLSTDVLLNECNLLDRLTQKSIKYIREHIGITKYEMNLNLYHMIYTAYVKMIKELNDEIMNEFSEDDFNTYIKIQTKEIVIPDDVREEIMKKY